MNKYPKNIFQVWMQGYDNIPKKIFKENVRNWQLLNPDWNYYFLDEKSLRENCRQFSPECLKTFDSFDVMHLKIDFGRYVTLYLYGGIYCDMDMYAFRSLSGSEHVQEFIKPFESGETPHVLGVSIINVSRFETLAIYSMITSFINNSVMLSTAKNPVLYEFITQIIKKSRNIQSQSDYNKIQELTGPIALNKFIYDNNINVYKFPHYIFEPAPAVGDADIRDSTIAIHKMELSWLSPLIKKCVNGYYNLKYYIPIIFLLIIIIILLLKKRR